MQGFFDVCYFFCSGPNRTKHTKQESAGEEKRPLLVEMLIVVSKTE